MTQVRVLLNPSSGRGRGARLRRRLEALAARAGLQVEESSSAEDLARRASRAAAEGVERLLVAGGDGTWHHAMRGLAGSATALAPLPAGTGNDLARSLGHPLGLEAAFASALAGSVARVDLGEIGGRPFCGVAGAGFDGAVAAHARTRVRRLRGPLVYAWSTCVTLASFRPPRATLEAGDERIEGEVFLVAFANLPSFGGGMQIAPGADPTDGRLDVVVVRRLSKLRLLLLFPRVYFGRHLGHPCVVHRRIAPGARLAFDRPQDVAGDGEALGTAGPAGIEIGVRAGALAVVRAPEF
jgi:diacylglycerol kinase (ATP)